MHGYKIELVPCGGPLHLEDLRRFRSRHLPVPHDYSSWPLHESTGTWRWCRAAGPDGQLVAGYAVHLFPGRAIPGTRIATVDHIGRDLHAPVRKTIGCLLAKTALSIPRLERLDARVFDESPVNLAGLSASIMGAGGIRLDRSRSYTRTLILDLSGTEADVMSRLAYSARRNIRRVASTACLRIEPIMDEVYGDRLTALLSQAFRRTEGTSPPIRFSDVMRDAASSSQSVLLGAFLSGRTPPDDLVGFMWSRLHGDHAVYEAGASERAPELGTIAVAYGIMLEVIRWARSSGATWLDLGGVTPVTESRDPLQGISTFKRHFSTDERTVAAEFRFEPRPALSRLAHASRWLAGLARGKP